MLSNYIRFFLENKLVAYLLLLFFVVWGLMTAPFDFDIDGLPRDPVAVDAIPDLGENQQIVFTKWAGRSPQDVEDQVTYPLTTALLGVPGVKSIRSNSMFGFSSIYIIFDEDTDFYWSRSRILEKLNSLSANTLPEGVQPTLGPDATALGQVYWYTLEGRDEAGEPTGGWDLHELRAVQDFYIRYGLSAAEGVSEVASIGGFVQEYQVDVDPEAMKANQITLEEVMRALQGSNIDIGAQTIEINLAEYFVRGLGYVQEVADIEQAVIKVNDNVPLRIGEVARVSLGPAPRRGILDKSGAEAVGGVVVARFGANPLEVINNVKTKIAELEPGLPTKVLADGRVSQVKIVPFYDRTQLINETIGTLEEALSLEILITIIVVILMLFNLKSSLLISATLPVAVLMCFVAMRYFGVDANIVALSGIAIAIGTMVDMGIVLIESIVRRMEEAPPDEDLFTTIYEATIEVAGAVMTAVATTVISFIPVFTMEAAEGKLFRPLAFTKTFALVASIVVAISLIPPLAHSIFSIRSRSKRVLMMANGMAVIGGIVLALLVHPLLGTILSVVGTAGLLHLWIQQRGTARHATILSWLTNLIYAGIVAWLLAGIWMPLGVARSNFSNFLFVSMLAGGLIGLFYLVIHFYESLLRFFLRFKIIFLLIVGLIVLQGLMVYQQTGEEFMPSLNEGSFLLMPTAMPHAGMQENRKNLQLLDMAVTAIPEVESVVGKAGRVNSALDPAPMSMYENVILYKSEYLTDEDGHRLRFRYQDGQYARDTDGELIPDKNGRYFRQWRDHIRSPDDIWSEIVRVSKLPGVTSAPRLQPIETRLVMLQTGMRAPMGIKVKGSDLATIEAFGLELEKHLQAVEGVKAEAVFADRIVGKPYLLLDIDRETISRYGLSIQQVQQYIQAAVGGMQMTTTVEGRERYAIRVRYPREFRDDPEALQRIYVATANQQQIPLGELVKIRYEAGAQSIKSEDGFLVGYVLFDRKADFSEVEVVENAQTYLTKLIDQGDLIVPAGVSYRFAGNYEQQVRASNRLRIVVPLALAIILLILYFQFKSLLISLMVFSGVAIAFAGGFIMIGLYDTTWFLDFSLFGTHMRDLFQVHTINLSVAVWVGFLALFGIATDDGVLVATFLQDSFRKNQPQTREEIRDAVVEGGLRRVRPAMMTTATTILALLPILSSTGRGADIMLPMAIPSFGGMTLQIITMFTVPVLYALWQEGRLRWRQGFLPGGKWHKTGLMGLLLLIGVVSSLRAQSLTQLRTQLVQQNPALQQLELEYQASLEIAPQLSQLPDPEVGVGYFPLPVETRLGSQNIRIGLMQMLPWFGSLAQRENLALAKAKAIRERVEVKKLDLLYTLEQTYFNLYELQQSQQIIKKTLPLLNALERLALAKVESGKASAADVLLVQLKIEELEQELSILALAEADPLATLQQLLNGTATLPIIISQELDFAEIPMNIDSLQVQIQAQHPLLRMYRQQQEVAREAIQLNTLAGKPDFGLGVDYILVDKRTDALPDGNGRDIVQLRASVKLPLFRKKYAAKEREEQLRIEALQYQQEEASNTFLAMMQKAQTQHRTARSQYDFALRQINLIEAAIRILTDRYSSQASDFRELLDLERERMMYERKRLNAIVQSHQAKSNIDRFLIR